jgi:hypothetical protein
MAEDANGGGPQAGDGPSEFAKALTSACALGSAIMGSMASDPGMTRAAAAFAPLIEPFRPTGGAATDISMAQDGVDIAGFLGQTWTVAASSGLRYLARRAQMSGEHQAGLLQALMSGGLSEDERRAMIDELRGYVRDLGDVSLQEARLLQSELERLSHGLAAAVDPDGAHAQHRRRRRAKP